MACMEEKFSLEPFVTKSMASCEDFSPKPFTAQAAAATAEEEVFTCEEAYKGCGSKRKAKEDGRFKKEAAVVVIWEQYLGADATTDDVAWNDGNDYDSDDDPETVLAKAKARFDAAVQRTKDRLPWLKYTDYSVFEGDSVRDDDDGAVVDGLVPA